MAYRSFDLGRCLRAGAAAVLLVFVASVPEAAAQDNLKRVALVIGNGTYRNAPALTNPANDVRAMAASLRDLGFEVEEGLDLDTAGMVGTIRRFGASAEGADVALVFYAGHGIQVDGVNYLLPVDVSLQRERDLSYEGIPLDLLTSEVGQARRLGVVILDACRDNPFATQLAQALGPTRSSVLGRGLARVENVPADTLIAFATSAGAVAEDGQSANSPYTTALLAHMREPGVEIGQYFRRVRDTVLQATNGRQQPYVYGSLSADAFYLNPPAGGLRVAAVTPAPLPAPRPEGRTEDRGMSSDTERLFWETIKDSTDRGDFDAYLRQFPNGVFTSLARNRIAVLDAGKAAVASPAPTQTAAVAPPAPPLGPADRREAQRALRWLGLYGGAIDGVFGPGTRAGVIAFQRSVGLPPDGRLTPAQLDRLLAETAAPASVESPAPAAPVPAPTPAPIVAAITPPAAPGNYGAIALSHTPHPLRSGMCKNQDSQAAADECAVEKCGILCEVQARFGPRQCAAFIESREYGGGTGVGSADTRNDAIEQAKIGCFRDAGRNYTCEMMIVACND